MRYEQHVHYFFLLFCLAVSFGVVYLIIQPFFSPLILAAVCAFLLQGVYKKLLYFFKNREGLAAFVTTLIAIVIILVPLTLLGAQVLKESTELYERAVLQDGKYLSTTIKTLVDGARTIVPIPEGTNLDIGAYFEQGLKTLASHLGSIFSSVAKLLLSIVVFLISLYFLLKDGKRLKDYIIRVSPLGDSDDEMIASRLGLAVSSAIKGNLAIGLIQGALTAIGFALFGVPNPVLWGSITTVAALIPGVGTALIITPAILFLFITGNIFGGIGLLIWGVTAVGLVDNLLGPRLIGRGMQLHPLAVFLSVLGGISFFGPLGFLLGPLAMSLCLAFIDIYSSFKTRV